MFCHGPHVQGVCSRARSGMAPPFWAYRIHTFRRSRIAWPLPSPRIGPGRRHGGARGRRIRECIPDTTPNGMCACGSLSGRSSAYSALFRRLSVIDRGPFSGSGVTPAGRSAAGLWFCAQHALDPPAPAGLLRPRLLSCAEKWEGGPGSRLSPRILPRFSPCQSIDSEIIQIFRSNREYPPLPCRECRHERPGRNAGRREGIRF